VTCDRQTGGGVSTGRTFRVVGTLALTCSLLLDVSAETKRDWQQGTWRDADKTIRLVGIGILSGTVVGNCVISPDGSSALAFQTCVIETEDYFYFGRKRLNFRATDGVPITANAPARFALEKETLYVIGNDGKEYKLNLVKKVVKTEKETEDVTGATRRGAGTARCGAARASHCLGEGVMRASGNPFARNRCTS
jgi:hypothetical protein